MRIISITKTMFSQNMYFGDSRVDFECCLEASEVVFLIFAALETGLKVEFFLRSTGDSECFQKIRGPD